MILNDKEIRERQASGDLIVSPWSDELVNPASLDFRLGNKFGEVKATTYSFENSSKVFSRTVVPSDPTTFETEYRTTDKYLLEPGGFVIASSLEDITIPNDLCFITKGKSSLGRLGLANSDQAGFVDPGWSGFITLELYNHSQNTILLTAGMKIGQWVFYRCNPPEKSYKDTGRYYRQDQGSGSKGI